MKYEEMFELKEKFKETFLSYEDAGKITIGLDWNANKMYVYVLDESFKADKRLPKTYEGIEVIIKNVGEIKPL